MDSKRVKMSNKILIRIQPHNSDNVSTNTELVTLVLHSIFYSVCLYQTHRTGITEKRIIK
jgi:hypothetical protein